MHIGYDPTTLGAHFGNSSYTTELVSALARRFPGDHFTVPSFFGQGRTSRRAVKNMPNAQVVSRLISPGLFPRPLRKTVQAVDRLIEGRLMLPGYDLYHCTTPTLWVDGARRSVLTIHDLIPLLGHPAWSSSREQAFYRDRLAAIIERSTRIVVDSEATRSLVVGRFPSSATRIDVVYLAAGGQFVQRKVDAKALLRYGIDGTDRAIVMSAGVFTGRKNIPRLLDAFIRLPAAIRNNAQIVLVGNRPQNKPYPPILDAIGRNRLEDTVRLVPNLPHCDLVSLYNMATVMAFPSLCEGFGLPVLEAMQCGCPVITSNCSSLPEAGGDAAWYCDPEDTESIRHALERVLSDGELRADLSQKGIRRSQGFSWEKTAEQTRAVYEKAVQC